MDNNYSKLLKYGESIYSSKTYIFRRCLSEQLPLHVDFAFKTLHFENQVAMGVQIIKIYPCVYIRLL